MATTADSPATPSDRIAGIDIVRGIVMVLMALDHVRVFAAVPAWSTEPSVFMTRWITNFCAPAFIFLAGTGAFLHHARMGDSRAMSRYLAIRGALLVFFEFTISRLSWTFNFDFYNYTEANVLWAIGWSMIALAALIHLPLRAIATFGIAVIALHNLMDPYVEAWSKASDASALNGLWRTLYLGGEFRFFGSGPKLVVLYTLVPWVGVIAAGYAFGRVMQFEKARRDKVCLWLGLGCTALFVVLRGLNTYGNPWPWSASDDIGPLLSFIAVNKYPASLHFLLMTLGPSIAAIPLFERLGGWLRDVLLTFGRAPLLYYLLHLPLIHAVAVLISLVRSPEATFWLFLNHPLRIPPAPEGYMWSLPMLYAVTALVVVILYFPCRWYIGYRRRQPDTWITRYI